MIPTVRLGLKILFGVGSARGYTPEFASIDDGWKTNEIANSSIKIAMMIGLDFFMNVRKVVFLSGNNS